MNQAKLLNVGKHIHLKGSLGVHTIPMNVKQNQPGRWQMDFHGNDIGHPTISHSHSIDLPICMCSGVYIECEKKEQVWQITIPNRFSGSKRISHGVGCVNYKYT